VQYVEALTRVFTEAQRVLKKEGSFWLNLGDKYVDKRLLGMPWPTFCVMRASRFTR
ncbi:MAG: site-specific DNA-methyltransferase, partial [Bacteroidales bacterium]|nr:site-specific DNA-methyltransferase [Bacteroidales bacterium]